MPLRSNEEGPSLKEIALYECVFSSLPISILAVRRQTKLINESSLFDESVGSGLKVRESASMVYVFSKSISTEAS